MPTPNDPLDPRALEQMLGNLVPLAPELDRDAVMYRAGQSAARRSALGWPWKAATFLLCCVCLTLALQLWNSQQTLWALQQQVEQLPIVQTPSAPEAEVAPPATVQAPREKQPMPPAPESPGQRMLPIDPLQYRTGMMLGAEQRVDYLSLRQWLADGRELPRLGPLDENGGQENPTAPDPPPTIWSLQQELYTEAL